MSSAQRSWSPRAWIPRNVDDPLFQNSWERHLAASQLPAYNHAHAGKLLDARALSLMARSSRFHGECFRYVGFDFALRLSDLFRSGKPFLKRVAPNSGLALLHAFP